jgi:hypothetical protein
MPSWKRSWSAKRGSRLLELVWVVLTRRQPYRHGSHERIAYKYLTRAWHIDKSAKRGMSNQQFAKYGLIRLGRGEHLTRIVKGGRPRRLAPKEEVLALKPELSLKP